MAPPKYRVQCCSFNGHLTVDFNAPDLTSWLIPTLEEGGHEYSGEDPPDFVAIGFQEMIPLHLSLSGLTKTALDLHDYKLKEAVERYAAVTGASEKKGRETYTLMAKKVLGGIALLVYTRDRTVTSRVVDVRVATAACGMFKVMGNKGGVGVRIVLDDEEDDEDDKYAPVEKDDTGNSVFTFVTAHLAAHDHGLKRRNEDYQSIVERLIFSSDGPSQHYQPRKPRNIFSSLKDVTLSAGGIQIYDTSYRASPCSSPSLPRQLLTPPTTVFFFGGEHTRSR
jgi:phosphatidylinositol-bisphosphatase